MNSEQREEILAVIKKDANGRGKLCRTYRGEDRMCILGGLLHEAGVPLDVLRNAKFPSAIVWQGKYGNQIILDAYGLPESAQTGLMMANDRTPSRGRRQAALREVIAVIPVEPVEGEQ